MIWLAFLAVFTVGAVVGFITCAILAMAAIDRASTEV